MTTARHGAQGHAPTVKIEPQDPNRQVFIDGFFAGQLYQFALEHGKVDQAADPEEAYALWLEGKK
jgi:hypothetical protein